MAGRHEITSGKDHVNVSMESGLEGLSRSNLGVTAIIQVDSSWQIYPPASKGFPGGCSLIDLITRISFHFISKKEVFNKTRIQSGQQEAIIVQLMLQKGFPDSAVVKKLLVNTGDVGLISGSG